MSDRHPEPEIIPPDRSRPDWRRERGAPWVSMDAPRTRRIYIRRVGPLGILLVALLIGIVAALIFVILVGAFLIWIPVAILLFVAAIVGGMMRRYSMRR